MRGRGSETEIDHFEKEKRRLASEAMEPLPPFLEKAIVDENFSYLIFLRSGMIIEFSGAAIIRPKWIRLFEPIVIWPPVPASPDGIPFNFERGLDVRIADIAIVSDAPHGS